MSGTDGSRLTVDGQELAVEVLESLVRGYLVRVPDGHGLAAGRRVELTIAATPPVPCTVAAIEPGGVRLLRGWGML